MRNHITKETLLIALAVSVGTLTAIESIAQPDDHMSAEENMKRQVFADDNFEAIMAPQNADFNEALSASNAPAAAVMQALDSMGYLQGGQGVISPPRSAPTTIAPPIPPPMGADGSMVEITMDQFEDLRTRVKAIRDRVALREGPTVALGSSKYTGVAIKGALSLNLNLQVTLGKPGIWKTVPLIGDDVVLVSGTVDGKPIHVSEQNGYHVWITRSTGEITLDLDILVPSRGPRGSLEYDFLVARTPVTSFSCSFPSKDLEPRLDAAVQSNVTSLDDSTLLDATLRPTTRIHLVGFKDLSESEGRKARVFAESMNLLSVDENTLDMFTVIRYTILYAGTKQFDILVPEGMTVISADGEGAFQFTQEKRPDGRMIIRGETAFPIRNGYEISLRMKRQMPRGEKSASNTIEVPIPRCSGVEREHGWLAVEVPGKLRLKEDNLSEITPIDMRQLPKEMIGSAVSPIIKAYRYHSDDASVRLIATRLPDKEPASGSVDRIRAFSVVSPEGKILTDMRITMRNRLRPTLTLTPPDGTEVLSVHLDGEAIRPARSKSGDLMLPLKRSQGQDKLESFTIQIVMESEAPPLGLFGTSDLSLPTVGLPTSTSSWTIFLPAKNIYSALEGDIDAQRFATQAHWHQPAHSNAPVRIFNTLNEDDDDTPGADGSSGADSGLMSVRIELPKTGTRMDYSRYWLEGDRPCRVTFTYMRGWLAIPAVVFLTLLLALGCLLVNTWRDRPVPTYKPIMGLLLLLASIWPLHVLGGTAAVAVGFVLGVAGIGFRRKWLKTIPHAVVDWMRDLARRHDAISGTTTMTTGAIVRKSLIATGLFIVFLGLFHVGIQLIELMMNPL